MASGKRSPANLEDDSEEVSLTPVHSPLRATCQASISSSARFLVCFPEEDERMADFRIQSGNEDLCTTCKDGGLLFCCESCPRAYHRLCREPMAEVMEDEPFYCSACPSNHSRPDDSNLMLNLRLQTSKPSFGHFELDKAIKTYFEGVQELEGGKFNDELSPGPK